jgi:four helix bundle protein
MSAPSFESLRIWHDARRLAREIYVATYRSTQGRDATLRDQLWRAGVSVMANIAEGHERSGAREFAHFLSIAKASCGEIRSHLYLAEDVEFIEASTARKLRTDAAILSRKIDTLRSAHGTFRKT